MRLYSLNMEVLALRSITGGDDRVAAWILPRLTIDHFALDATREAFKRMSVRIRKEGNVPEWSDLLAPLTMTQGHGNHPDQHRGARH